MKTNLILRPCLPVVEYTQYQIQVTNSVDYNDARSSSISDYFKPFKNANNQVSVYWCSLNDKCSAQKTIGAVV